MKNGCKLNLIYPFVVEKHFDEAAQRFSGGVRTRAYWKK